MLLEAAKDIVKENGVDGLTIARLASRIGASVGGVYRHFDSKGAILVALEVWAIESFGEQLEADLVQAIEPGLSKKDAALFGVLVSFTAYARHATRDPERHQLLDAFLADARQILSDEEARTVEGVLAPILGRCAGLVGAAVEAGLLARGDDVQRTYVAWAMLHGVDHFRKRDRLVSEVLHARTVMRSGLAALLVGWGAQRADVDAAFKRLDAVEEALIARPMPVPEPASGPPSSD